MVWLDDAEEPIEELVPTYDSLEVAREGRDVRVAVGDPAYEATSFVTVLSLPYLLDQLVSRLAAAVDGDPSTPTT